MTAITAEMTAPTVTALGRSPSSSGSQLGARLGVPRLRAARHPLLRTIPPPPGPPRRRWPAPPASRRRSSCALGGAALALAALGPLALAAAHQRSARAALAAGSTASNSSAAAARGSGGVADRPHHADPPCARARPPRSTFPASMPPIANQGSVAVSQPPRGSARARSPAGPLRRRLPDRPDADVVDRLASAAASICSREWVERPMIASAPRISRASAGSMSSWPTWTPSASSSSARWGSSLTMKRAP